MNKYSIFWDIGDVLYHVMIDRAYFKFYELTGLNRWAFGNALFTDNLIQKFNSGKLQGAMFIDIINKRLDKYNVFLSMEQLRLIYESVLVKREEVFAWFASIRNQYELFWIISDISDYHWNRISSDFGSNSSRLIDGATLSYEVGTLKPDNAIFSDALKRSGINPKKAIFFDDLPRNIEGAKKNGMIGHQFVSLANAQSFLETL